jgi:hypothetical protein
MGASLFVLGAAGAALQHPQYLRNSHRLRVVDDTATRDLWSWTNGWGKAPETAPFEGFQDYNT